MNGTRLAIFSGIFFCPWDERAHCGLGLACEVVDKVIDKRKGFLRGVVCRQLNRREVYFKHNQQASELGL